MDPPALEIYSCASAASSRDCTSPGRSTRLRSHAGNVAVYPGGQRPAWGVSSDTVPASPRPGCTNGVRGGGAVTSPVSSADEPPPLCRPNRRARRVKARPRARFRQRPRNRGRGGAHDWHVRQGLQVAGESSVGRLGRHSPRAGTSTLVVQGGEVASTTAKSPSRPVKCSNRVTDDGASRRTSRPPDASWVKRASSSGRRPAQSMNVTADRSTTRSRPRLSVLACRRCRRNSGTLAMSTSPVTNTSRCGEDNELGVRTCIGPRPPSRLWATRCRGPGQHHVSKLALTQAP